MNQFPLKWKLSISFVLLSLSLVAVYVLLAKRTFEFDKISYIFETQQREVNLQSALFRAQIEQALFETKTVLQSIDSKSSRSLDMAQKMVEGSTKILSLEIRREDSGATLFKANKSGISADRLEQIKAPTDSEKYVIQHLSEDYFGLQIRDAIEDGTPVLIRILCDFKDSLLSKPQAEQLFLMTEGARALPKEGLSESFIESLNAILSGIDMKREGSTQQVQVGSEEYLLSVSRTGVGEIAYLSLINQKAALSALDLLMKRSVIFILFSVFATIILSILISNRLTRNINALTVTAAEISKGHFDSTPGFQSNDEVGVLAKAFVVMAREIERLIGEFIEKTRMEEELKTASLVQENLFPAKSSYLTPQIHLSGMNLSSSECSGDWWYYFPRGNKVYAMIGDATGHGTPAALITAVARAVFSVIENNASDVVELARSWDRAVRDCSKGSLYMTAFVLELDLTTGEAKYVNSSHEPPVLMRKDPESGKAQAEMLECPINHRLGEMKEKWVVGKFQMNPNDRLVIYTDGFYTLKDRAGKQLNDRRWMKMLTEDFSDKANPNEVVEGLTRICKDSIGNGALEDDITLMVIDRRA